jgi:four helix bundle protein
MSKTYSSYDPDKDFTTLDAWKRARDLKLFFYREVIPVLPAEERFNLNVQIRKASVSGTANISEGYGRYYYKEGIQFYRVSRGSVYELKDHLISCFDFGFVSKDILDRGISLIEETKVVLNGWIRYVESQKSRGT